MRGDGDVELSLLQPWVCYKRGCSLQEGVDQSGQPGNIFTSQFSLDAAGESRRGSGFMGSSGECSTSSLSPAFWGRASSPTPLRRDLCLLGQTDLKFLCFHLFSFLPRGDSTLSSSAHLVLPLLLAGVGSGHRKGFLLCQDSLGSRRV